MRLSELYATIKAAGDDVLPYTLWLASPDKDGSDVDLASVGRVDVDSASGEARLYPASTTTDTDSIDPEPYLDLVMSQLPSNASGDNDLRLVVETPLLRDPSGSDRVAFSDVYDVRVGNQSEEIWFLVRPASEFADGLMPE
jgi:hypothetical protein